MNVLLVEDNPGDVRLTQEAFKEAKMSINLDVTMDGAEAIKFLRKQAPYEDARNLLHSGHQPRNPPSSSNTHKPVSSRVMKASSSSQTYSTLACVSAIVHRFGNSSSSPNLHVIIINTASRPIHSTR